MNKLIIALGLTLAASTGAFADSSALDAFVPQAPNTSTIDYTPMTRSSTTVQAMTARQHSWLHRAALTTPQLHRSVATSPTSRSSTTVPTMTARRPSLAKTSPIAGPVFLPAGPAPA